MNGRFLNFNITRENRKHNVIDDCLVSVKNENSNAIFKPVLSNLPMGNISKYPQLPKLYKKFKTHICGFRELIFGMGSDSLLKDLFLVLDYDSIQVFDLSYQMAIVYNKLLSKDIRVNSFLFKNDEFTLKEDIRKLGGDILYLVRPHCPTGYILPFSEIKPLSHHFKYIIIDEAYVNPLQIDWNLFNIPNVILVKSFSKLGGVPGLRLGYCLTGDTNVIERLQKIAPLYDISTPAANYLNWILDNPYFLPIHESHLDKTYNILKTYATFSLKCANFALLQPADRFFGKRYTIDGQTFSRVTLTDAANASKLLLL